MAKLTLSVDPSVVARARRYARQRGVSISGMVEAYLASLTASPEIPQTPPILRALRGTLKRGGLDDYRRHLGEKYR